MTINGVVKMKKIIFLALLGGILVATAMFLYLIVSGTGIVIDSFTAPYSYLGIFFAIAGIVASRIFYIISIKKLKAENDEQKKFLAYSSVYIPQFALIEGAAIVNIVFFLLSGEIFYIGFVLILILYFITLFPTEEKVKKDLGE